jgi:hypothetical protein
MKLGGQIDLPKFRISKSVGFLYSCEYLQLRASAGRWNSTSDGFYRRAPESKWFRDRHECIVEFRQLPNIDRNSDKCRGKRATTRKAGGQCGKPFYGRTRSGFGASVSMAVT